MLLVTGQDGTDQLLAGVDPIDGRVRVKLAPDGIDVKTAQLLDLVWSSDALTFKVLERGTATIQGGNNTVTFAHADFENTYDKPPIVWAFAEVTDGSTTAPKQLPYVNYIADAGADPFMYGVYYILDVAPSKEKVEFILDNTFNGFGSSVSASIRFYVVADPSAA
jgi:hypothetical protein